MDSRKIVKTQIKSILQYLFRRHILLVRNPFAKGVSITFDDGPHIKNTEKIVKILNERSIKSTFFILGSQLEAFPDLGTLISENGHELGNHTFNHTNIKAGRLNEFNESVMKTEQLISKYSKNNYRKIFRPPYGTLNPSLLLYMIFREYLLVGWTIDSRDSFVTDTKHLVNYVADLSIRNGDIILFHEDYSHTVAALPDILDALIDRGFKFLPVSQLNSMRKN
jgi:peptidoglycan/xylan/chitin deacetylase (PgdA/CDA1 family)